MYMDSSAIVKRYITENGTDIVDELFQQAESKHSKLCFSIWNIGEVIGAFDKFARKNKEDDLTNRIGDFLNELRRLMRIGSIETIEIGLSLIFDSVKMIIKHKIYIADALQIVSCKQANCDEFFTGDRKLYTVAMEEGISSTYLG
jgi:predicted nucleic acid-binding protein